MSGAYNDDESAVMRTHDETIAAHRDRMAAVSSSSSSIVRTSVLLDRAGAAAAVASSMHDVEMASSIRRLSTETNHDTESHPFTRLRSLQTICVGHFAACEWTEAEAGLLAMRWIVEAGLDGGCEQ
jgi:hypothetical protein